ncbi:MAG: EamA family transporter [Candidatus Acidiferrales bacterium]
MGIFLALTAALCWGVSDFVARFASRRIGAYRALLVMQVIGLLALTIYLESTGGFLQSVAPGWQPWLLAVFAAVLNTVGSLALYYAFQVGVMTIVAPISSSYPAITVTLALLSGERIRVLSAAGLGITLLGLILAATSFEFVADGTASVSNGVLGAHLSRGAGWSLVSTVAFGIMFWFLGFHVLPVMGAAVSVWVVRLSTSCVLLLSAAPARQTLRLPQGGVWWLLVVMGLVDTTAYVANNAGLRIGPVSIVTVIASLYGAVTVLLSSIFLRERLRRSQWLGVALIFTGIVVVNL